MIEYIHGDLTELTPALAVVRSEEHSLNSSHWS